MITPGMQAIYLKLKSVAPVAVSPGEAKDYLPFKAGRLNIAGVYSDGTSFSTDDERLLDHLRSVGITFSKVPSDKPRDKFRYKFAELKPADVDAHLDSFKKLFEDSVRLKQHKR
ncbi:hypothetical protein [Granulicella sibirica]|uniref:Uncharacterized protein n=1 Tax=Granulicella sibirica TaxID=2479048 RepID=A0A4Q0SZD9_9BACT|nr:hypothetical protein [Granulicella sibirica]RXH56247.1 hypothetical protein GRAN_3104 [Granulicella sibirica]